jgi:hypothetical protein
MLLCFLCPFILHLSLHCVVLISVSRFASTTDVGQLLDLQDADAAYGCVCDFPEACCVIVKHTNPCGVAARDDLLEVSQRPAPARWSMACTLSSAAVPCAVNRPGALSLQAKIAIAGAL